MANDADSEIPKPDVEKPAAKLNIKNGNGRTQ
jgi:hypothetical protein